MGRYSHAVAVAIPEQASAGRTIGRLMLPIMTSAVNRAPPSGTLYTAASPAPPPHAISSRRWAGVSRAQPARMPADAPPISLGAASRPSDAPIPMTISEMTEVPSDRRKDSRVPSPHTSSSRSDFSPWVKRRSRNQAIPPNTPALSSTTRRRRSDACSAADSSDPVWYPNARCWTVNRSSISRSPNSPAATPVSATMAQNRGVSAASPSPVAFGCSVAPRPDGSR